MANKSFYKYTVCVIKSEVIKIYSCDKGFRTALRNTRFIIRTNLHPSIDTPCRREHFPDTQNCAAAVVTPKIPDRALVGEFLNGDVRQTRGLARGDPVYNA